MSCENSGFIPAIDAKKLSADWSLIFKEICAIQQAILTAIDDNAFSTVVDGNSPFTSLQGIQSVDVLNSLTGYNEVFLTDTDVSIQAPSTGTGAVLSPVVDITDGRVTDFTIGNVGFGYSIHDPVVIDSTSTGGSGFNGAVSEVTNEVNKVSSVIVTSVLDRNYVVGDKVDIPVGEGFEGTLVVDGFGVVTEVTIVEGGIDYQDLDTIEISGAGTAFTGTLVVDENGTVTSVTIVDGGSNYTINDVITIDTLNSGSGFEGTVSEVDAYPEAGKVISIAIDHQGEGYSFGNTLRVKSIHGAGFVGAVGSVSTSTGHIKSIEIIDGGEGYYNPPASIVVNDPTKQGSGATFEINTNECGTITSVDVLTTGHSYSKATTLTVTPDLSLDPADPDTALMPNIYMSSVDATEYWAVWAEQISDRQIQYQLEYVTKYFQDLGYQIQAQTNPSTMVTLQWNISW